MISTLLLAPLSTPAAPHYSRSLSSLNEAYLLLSQAAPVYKGHRGKAMNHIYIAARLRNERVGGRSNYKRPGDSQSKLRAAQSILQRLRFSYSGDEGEHLDKAIQEINIALSIQHD